MKNILFTMGFVLALGLSAQAKDCKKGKACGNTCIAQTATCHMDEKKAKVCKKGKACGDTCIAATATCTK
jgi:hypothetical protein